MKKLIVAVLITAGAFSICHAQTPDSVKSKRDTTTAISKLADGSSFARAIVIKEKTEMTGGPAEYTWLHHNYPGGKVNSQALVYHDKKPYDILHIVNAEGVPLDIYFDISNFFGKL